MSLPSFKHCQTITHTACDQDVYQQDIVIHRAVGINYEEVVGGLNVWHVFVGDRCRTDYGDIRFVKENGEELAYYLWPDFTYAVAKFTIKLENASESGRLIVLYGNSNETTNSNSNGDATFLWFDHFDKTTLNTAKWDKHPSANVYISDGKIYVKGNYDVGQGTFYGIVGRQLFNTEQTILEISATGFADRFAMMGWGKSNTTYSMSLFGFRMHSVGIRQITTQSGSGSYVWVDHMWSLPPNVYKLRRDGSTELFYVGNTLSTTYSVAQNVPTEALAPAVGTNGEGGYIVIDYILVRAYSSNPPAAVTFSGEQTNKHRQSVSFGSDSLMVI